MNTSTWPGKPVWPLWQKLLFRFFFVYLILYIAPWTWIEYIPGADNITQYYYRFIDWCVHASNEKIFHVRKVLVPLNGSGDTSYAWVQLWLFSSIAIIAAATWSLFDIKRKNYNRLSYWFRLVVRYFVIINCFGYGIIKLFGLQMTYPGLSQLATPLGDFLPMRFSWMFMGYSLPYQAFTGAMEVIAGLLLLFRQTSTFGALIAAGVFANVMMLNLGYDIPVKLYSTHLLIMCFVLLAYECKRILSFIFNRAAPASSLYRVRFSKKWMRVARILLKLAFILVIVIHPVKDNNERYNQIHSVREIKPVREGIYEVYKFAVNNDTIPYTYSNEWRWQNMIFERGGTGSVNSTDTIFRQRYHRGYFNYSADTINETLEFSKSNVMGEHLFLFRMKYEIPDSNTIRLYGTIRSDSVFAELKRTNRHFQLTEQQFHWLSEYNR